jgi:hypothetical protein
MQKLPNEILLLIIEKYIYSNCFYETTKLKKVNKFFEIYCNKFQYKKAIGITKKHMKNIEQYIKHDAFDCIKALIMDSDKENKIFRQTNTEITNKNIREIILPSHLSEYEPIYDNKHGCFISDKINIFNYDVIQSIIIRGTNIKRVVIGLPHNMIYDYHYNNNDMVTIYLSKNGLYSCLLIHSEGIRFIHVYAENCKKIYAYGKFFDNPTESRNNIIRALTPNSSKFSKFEQIIYGYNILL